MSRGFLLMARLDNHFPPERQQAIIQTDDDAMTWYTQGWS